MDFFEIENSLDDMGVLVVENAFINHFMPKAKGEYVKVYLYGLKLALKKDVSKVDDSHIASCLDMDEKDVRKAWDYWQKKKLIEFVPGVLSNKVIFKNVQQVLMGMGEPTAVLDSDDPVFTKRQEKTMKNIEKSSLKRPFTVTEAIYFSTWFNDYGFTENMVSLIIDYSINKKQKDIRYWNKIAVSAFDAKIKTYDALSDFLNGYDERQKKYIKVLKYLGLYDGRIGEPEKKLMDKWFDEDKYTMKEITTACDETVATSRKSLRYVDSVLKNRLNEKPKTSASKKKKTQALENSQNYDINEVEELLYGDFK